MLLLLLLLHSHVSACCGAVPHWLSWYRPNVVGRINEVNQRRARLVLGWVAVYRQLNHLGM